MKKVKKELKGSEGGETSTSEGADTPKTEENSEAKE